MTDRFMREWAAGSHDDSNETLRTARVVTGLKLETSEEAFALLHADWATADRRLDERVGETVRQWDPSEYVAFKRDRRRRWQSLSHLLDIYGPEVLKAVDSGLRERRVLLDEIVGKGQLIFVLSGATPAALSRLVVRSMRSGGG
jgi:hypothetical protein